MAAAAASKTENRAHEEQAAVAAASSGDDPLAQSMQQQQQGQYHQGAQAGYSGVSPAHPYCEQAQILMGGDGSNESHMQQYNEVPTHQYTQHTAEHPRQGGTQQNLSAQQPETQQHYNEHAKMMQQGAAAALAQGAFQQEEARFEASSVSQLAAASEVMTIDMLTFR